MLRATLSHLNGKASKDLRNDMRGQLFQWDEVDSEEEMSGGEEGATFGPAAAALTAFCPHCPHCNNKEMEGGEEEDEVEEEEEEEGEGEVEEEEEDEVEEEEDEEEEDMFASDSEEMEVDHFGRPPAQASRSFLDLGRKQRKRVTKQVVEQIEEIAVARDISATQLCGYIIGV